MDCDGPKHALISDIDGLFLGSSPAEGSIVPFAELRSGKCYCQSMYLLSRGTSLVGYLYMLLPCFVSCWDVCRFNPSRIPSTWLASSGPNIYHSPEDVVQWKGIARGTTGCVHSKHALCDLITCGHQKQLVPDHKQQYA